MVVRWFITILLSFLAAGSMYYVSSVRTQLAALEMQRSNQRSELQRTLRLESELKAEAVKIQAWNHLWTAVQQARLDPQDHWFINTINTKARVEWPEMASLLTYVSYSDERSTGYWFSPNFLHVKRVKPESTDGEEGALDEESNEQAQNDLARNQNREEENLPEMFDVHLNGQFLIPKE